ncbi:MAG: flagellar motor protein [Candidatus Cloacimonadota bacterium]|nr:MAG: flagellar motor protein [Candidatus Cloacimonadota bacterium]
MDIDEEEVEQECDCPETECSEGAPEWMVTYGDLVTLLMCFFVLLFSMSKVEEEKFQQIAESLRSAIGNDDVPEAGTREGLIMKSDGENESKIDAVDELGAMIAKEMDEIQSEVEEFILKNKLGGQVKTEVDDRGFVITISDVVLFNPGRAVINESSEELLTKMKDILIEFPYRVRVEGHTDNTPIHTLRYPSNWELSSGRACEVVRYFIERGIPPEQLSAEGFAHYRPVADNSSRDGRAHNRRVEIVYIREAMVEELKNNGLEEFEESEDEEYYDEDEYEDDEEYYEDEE